MRYTYTLESTIRPGEHYIGHTSDIRKRLQEHNAGKCAHTAKLNPWKLKVSIAFDTLEQAQHFDRYLKPGSGHAFANGHFWPSPPASSDFRNLLEDPIKQSFPKDRL
jgi:predicted GIY-YIG superfamily endonuclease